ncbi:MAG: hypothetical protein II777_05385, partial [Clostridia bacterium]|nr:hypothetical protein [Clostridia bacterium]
KSKTVPQGAVFDFVVFIQGSKGSGSELSVRGTVKSRGRPSAGEARERALFGAPEKTSRERGFFNSIRLRRVILLRSYIRLTPSYIALRAVKRRIEYHFAATPQNITFARRANISHPADGEIYYFCNFTR